MSIIHEHKLIFIHTAKTAGTSISDYFNSERGHHNIARYSDKLGTNFRDYKSFIVVRDPVERFLSAWNMVVADPVVISDMSEQYPEFSLEINEALSSGVVSRLRSDPSFGWFWSQTELLITCVKKPQSNKPAVPCADLQYYVYVPDYVLFFDNLVNDFEKFCSLESIKFDSTKFLHLQKSPQRWKISDLGAPSIDTIQSCYQDDYALIDKVLPVNSVDPTRAVFNLNVERGIPGMYHSDGPPHHNHVAGLMKVVRK